MTDQIKSLEKMPEIAMSLPSEPIEMSGLIFDCSPEKYANLPSTFKSFETSLCEATSPNWRATVDFYSNMRFGPSCGFSVRLRDGRGVILLDLLDLSFLNADLPDGWSVSVDFLCPVASQDSPPKGRRAGKE